MRVRAWHLAIVLGGLVTAAAAEVTQREILRNDWHRCLRQHFSGQPKDRAQQAAERAALAACKPSEDAYVAAELAEHLAQDEALRRTDRTLSARARAMLVSVTAYVVEPVTSWLGAFGR